MYNIINLIIISLIISNTNVFALSEKEENKLQTNVTFQKDINLKKAIINQTYIKKIKDKTEKIKKQTKIQERIAKEKQFMKEKRQKIIDENNINVNKGTVIIILYFNKQTEIIK